MKWGQGSIQNFPNSRNLKAVYGTVEIKPTYMNYRGAHSSLTNGGRELKLCMKQHHTKGYCWQK